MTLRDSSRRAVWLFPLLVGATSSASANFLVNPSFEQPPLRSDQMVIFGSGQTIGAGWVADGPSGSVVIPNGYTPYLVFWPASDGRQSLFLNYDSNMSAIHQDVVLDASTDYRLTFDLGGLRVPLHGRGTYLRLDILHDGSSVVGGYQIFTREPGEGFAAQQLDFKTTTAGTYRLVLDSPSLITTMLDNFSLTATSVPEPSSMALAALGLVALAAYAGPARRLRRSKPGRESA